MITNETVMKIVQTELSASGYVEDYKKSILRAQKQFFVWTENQNIKSLDNITKKDINDYQNHLLKTVSEQTGKPLACGTLCEKYNAVKLIFSALCRADLLKENITSGLTFEIPKREGLKRQAFSEDAMSDLLEKIDIHADFGLRNRAIFELIYSSGLRVSEISKLTLKDISLERREMVVKGKFSRDRLVPISKMAHKYLALYLKDRVYINKDEPVFLSKRKNKALTSGSISRIFTELLIKHDMKKRELSAHSIRHTSASLLLNNGASIRHVQELLGHKNLETTAIYTHTQNEKLGRIFRKHHPQEHDLFDAVDDEYKRRMERALGIERIE